MKGIKKILIFFLLLLPFLLTGCMSLDIYSSDIGTDTRELPFGGKPTIVTLVVNQGEGNSLVEILYEQIPNNYGEYPSTSSPHYTFFFSLDGGYMGEVNTPDGKKFRYIFNVVKDVDIPGGIQRDGIEYTFLSTKVVYSLADMFNSEVLNERYDFGEEGEDIDFYYGYALSNIAETTGKETSLPYMVETIQGSDFVYYTDVCLFEKGTDGTVSIGVIGSDWFVIAIAFGLIVTGLILLATRKKKAPGKMVTEEELSLRKYGKAAEFIAAQRASIRAQSPFEEDMQGSPFEEDNLSPFEEDRQDNDNIGRGN